MTQLTRHDATRQAIPAGVFAIAVTGAFMVSLDLSIVNVAFPSIRASFDTVSTTTLSWVLSAYSVVFGALLLGAGRLADRSGRKRSFLRGLVVFTVGSAICGFAPAVGVLIGGRVLQAVGAALLMPASLALLLGATPERERPRAVAMWGGIAALAVAVGPSLGSLLIEAGGWRWAFVVNLPIALVAGIAGRRTLTESATGGPLPDLIGIGIVTVAVASLALAITEGSAWGWTSWRILAAFVATIVLTPIALRRSAVHPAPAIELRVFEARSRSPTPPRWRTPSASSPCSWRTCCSSRRSGTTRRCVPVSPSHPGHSSSPRCRARRDGWHLASATAPCSSPVDSRSRRGSCCTSHRCTCRRRT
jgi:hypothetical protein